MTFAQGLSFAIIGLTVAVFVWGRFRNDLVALVALLVALASGDVPVRQAFTGFTSDVVVIIASALIVSAGIARSGVVEWAVRPVLDRLQRTSVQVPVLAGTTAVLSMLTKNVGALAIMMPVALRVARKSETSASSLLMPMSFLSLLGGLVTLVGTSTNIIASQVRQDTLGKPFNMYDFAPVGLFLTALGFAFVSFGWRLLPRDRKGQGGLETATVDAIFVTEAKIPDALPEGLATISDLNLGKDGVQLRAVIGSDGRRRVPLPDATLLPGTSLVLEGDDASLDRFFTRVPLAQARNVEDLAKDAPADEMRTIEAVIQPDSALVDRSVQSARLQDAHGVQLMGVARSNERITERLGDVQLRAGDVVVLRASEKTLPETISALGLLPLYQRMVKLGDPRQRFLPILILAAAMILVALKIVPVVGAFFGAAVMMIVVGALSTREAYGALEPEVLVLIGALTPLSEAVQHSGGSALIAHALAGLLVGVPALLALAAIMVASMACSPFLHNAPTVLILGPIGVAVARALHLNPDPFLIAVATGAGCDFLTPVGHQCNTLVMGPGGYRFGDYWRLGLPLSVLVLVAGSLAISVVWPLAG